MSLLSQSCFIVLVAFCCLTQATYTSVTNYVNRINLTYNGTWQCDLISCPSATYGCQINYYNNLINSAVLQRSNSCYMEDGSVVASVVKTDFLNYLQNINISVNSYIGASSVYSIGFSSTAQIVQGTISPNGWFQVQDTMRELMPPIVGFS